MTWAQLSGSIVCAGVLAVALAGCDTSCAKWPPAVRVEVVASGGLAPRVQKLIVTVEGAATPLTKEYPLQSELADDGRTSFVVRLDRQVVPAAAGIKVRVEGRSAAGALVAQAEGAVTYTADGCMALRVELRELSDGGVVDRPRDVAGDVTAHDLRPPYAGPPPGTWMRIPTAGPPGTFNMGSPSTEICRSSGDIEETLHSVKLTVAFFMQTTEVTRGQFKQVMGYEPVPSGACSTCPVGKVTWHQAASYCNALSQGENRQHCYSCVGAPLRCTVAVAVTDFIHCQGYRLPTEAEWEFAYRAGSAAPFYNGGNLDAVTDCGACVSYALIDKIAWYCGTAKDKVVRPVGTLGANAFGLLDMAGNAAEWVNDVFVVDLLSGLATDPVGPPSGKDRTTRGGSVGFGPASCRAAARDPETPEDPFSNVGFRCVRSDL